MYDSSFLETLHVIGLTYYNSKQNIKKHKKTEGLNTIKHLFISIVLLLVLSGLLICFSATLTKIFNTYGFHFVKVWLIQALIILFIVRGIIYYCAIVIIGKYSIEYYGKESEIEKCTIRKGDLLVCEGGDIGRAAIWDKDYSICIQNHLHRLRPKGDVVPLLYLYYIMYLKLTNNLEGKGIGLQGFSSGLLDKLEVPLPPYNEQIRIVDKIQEAFNMLDSIAELLN